MYHQRIHEPDETKWRYRIITGREVVGFQKLKGREKGRGEGRLRLSLRDTVSGVEYWEGKKTAERESEEGGRELVNGITGSQEEGKEEDDSHAIDLVIVATGYVRNAHEYLLSSSRHLLAHTEPTPSDSGAQQGKFAVGRDYRVLYDKEKVDEECGVWLQGCCQDSHGVCSPPSTTLPYSPLLLASGVSTLPSLIGSLRLCIDMLWVGGF